MKSPPPPEHDNEPATAAKSDALSDPGIEKLIPIRFINLKSCAPGPGCPDNSDYYDILRGVDAANEVFKAASMQFWPKSIERYQMPEFADLRTSDCGGTGNLSIAWSAVRDQLQLAVPDMPDWAWADTDQKSRRLWLRAANTTYSNSEELIIWLVEHYSCGGGHGTANPYEGRAISFEGSEMDLPYKLSHEMGHFFGLTHPWNDNTMLDPQTQVAAVKSDLWDLYYKPGAGPLPDGGLDDHKFFTSKTQASAHESALRRIQTAGDAADNCPIDANEIVTCTIKDCPTCYQEIWSTGSAPMKGLGFTFAGGAMGPNLMGYQHLDQPVSRGLSDSQVSMVRKYLRWSVQVDANNTALIMPGSMLSTQLPRLGSWNLRPAASKLDFDCDGKRDVGVWEPTTAPGTNGTFTILLSSKGFSTSPGQYMSVQLGQLGDVPVVGDFSGDCKTDVAVYQPGGGASRNDPNDTAGWWRWCPTLSTPEYTTCLFNQYATSFGTRADVPMAGLSFNGQVSSPQITVFSPNEGKWSWRTVSPQLPSSRYLGGRGSVLLPGDYDGDFLADIAVYDRHTSYFKLLRSQQSWNTTLYRYFGSQYIPANSGTSQDRAGAIPLAGVNRPRVICAPYCLTYPRRVFSLWFPHDGTWTTMWDPVNSSAKDTCQWGNGAMDMPITGIERNGDFYTDMASYRGETWAGPGWFYFKNASPSAPNACTGSTASVYYDQGNRIRQRVFGVADMTGDGKVEIMLVDPDAMKIQWMTSESGYTTVHSRTIGTQRAIVL